MKTKKNILSSYKITSDSNFNQSISPIPDYINNQLEDLHSLALRGRQSGLNKFLRLVDKFPKVAILKNYLSVNYLNMGNAQKAHEVNHWIVAEHPDYFFGIINLASEYLEKKQYDKIEKLLGEDLDIKYILPDRDTFHIDELTSYFAITAMYCAAIQDLEQADIRLEILNELNPDHHKTIAATQHVEFVKMGNYIDQIKEQRKDNILVDVKETQFGNTTRQPNFENLGIYLLYNSGTDINQEYLHKILKLPKISIIPDLEMVLKDSIERYNYFTDNISNDNIFEEETSFAQHALFLLGDMEAHESLDSFFSFMKQDNDFYDFYLGDVLTEYFWIALYKIANNNFNELLEFIKQPSIYTFCRTAVSDVICQTAIHQPERRSEAIDWYKKALNFFLNSEIEDNVIDSDVLGGLVGDILDIQGKELLPEIEKLYEKNLVDIQSCGNIDEVKKSFKEEDLSNKREILSIFEIYDRINSWGNHDEFTNYSPTTDDDIDLDLDIDLQPYVSKEEPRRNEPCPCGSGKKYKKCCMNKK